MKFWPFRRAEIANKLSLRFIELIVLIPIGFVSKILHYSVRKISSPLIHSSFACLTLNAPIVLTFQSPEKLQEALFPHTIVEIENRIASSQIPLNFQYNAALEEKRTIPLRNPGTGNLLKNEVFKTELLTVYYPETPRVPHHLIIALNRPNVKGITDVSEEENQALFTMIRKIAEIYKTVSIQGFVIAQFDKPQQGHLNRYVVEIIPHLPGFKDIINIADKVDCNRYVLFRHANLSSVICKLSQESIAEHTSFWQDAFKQEKASLKEEDITVAFPHSRYESNEEEAKKILQQHLIELLQDKGAQIPQDLSFESILIPTKVPKTLKTIKVFKCPFCDSAVLNRQLVYEYKDVEVLYNIRKGAKPECSFLVLPKRHTEKVYGLSSEEIHNISIVRKALVEALKETHPGYEIIIYIQDDPAIGQTVFHSHEQVVALDPKTIALSWTLMSLYPSGNVSDEEMLQVREEFGHKMQQKIKKISELKKAIFN